MEVRGFRGVSRRRREVTTKRSAAATPAPELVHRDFRADSPNQLWVTDITYVSTWSTFLCVTILLDVWSRREVGWAMRTDLRAD